MNIRPTASNPYGYGQAFHATDYLRVLYKRRWTALLALLVVFAFSTVNSLKKTPIYEASTQVLIEKDARRASQLSTVLQDQELFSDDEFYQTQYRILQSRGLAARTLERLGWNKPSTEAANALTAPPKKSMVDNAVDWVSNLVGAPKLIAPPPADETTAQAQLVSGFLGGLSIEAVRNTHLVNIKYQSPDPQRAQQAANALALEYIASSKDSRSGASKEATDYLKIQLEEQQAKLLESQNKLAQYKETHDASSLDTPQNIVASRLADVSASLNAATMARIEKGAVYDAIQSKASSREALMGLPVVQSNMEITKLKQDIRNAEKAVADMDAAGVGKKRTEYTTAVGALATLNAQLDQEMQQVVASAKNEWLMAKSKEDSLKGQLEHQKQEINSQNKTGIYYDALKREVESNKQLFDTLLQRTKETGVTSEFKGSSIEIVDKAEMPRTPIYPRTSRDLMVGFMAGCLLALTLAFGFEYMDSRIRTPDEITQHLQLPFLGIVPSIVHPSDGSTPLITSGAPATFAEAVRAIRTAVIFSSAAEGARSVLITSTAPHEGKTLVSSNLACALAQSDQRTLIIDGDMRRPRVHEVFKAPQEPGLSNVLVGTSELHEAVRSTGIPNLYILPAGHLPPNPAELLGSNKYTEVLNDLRHQFDWIIVDAPPVMAVTDACVIAHRATGVLFVVGAEMTARRTATFALDQLRAAKAHFIGAVLNRADVQRHAYYYAPYYRKDYTQAYSAKGQ
jgi:capsular exopolysaccharide synthesis family protein